MLLLIYPFYANIKQMHENKNAQSLTNRERLSVGVGAALVGAMVIGGVTSANEINNADTSYASELPSFDQSTSPIAVHLEPVVSGHATEQAVNQAPKFKGKVIIKKSVATSLAYPEKSIAEIPESNNKEPINVILPPFSVETTQSTTEKVSLHPELMTVPENVKAIMDRDTVYISSGCSGSIVRSRLGEAIGIVTAEHCGLRGFGEHSNTRIAGGDGQNYIVTGAPVEAKTGPDQAHLKSAGVINEFLVPSKNDTSQDIAFGAFTGHTSKEVAEAYNHNKLSAKELSKLNLGDKMYISGWPVDQPKNDGNFERQNFPLSYLGEEIVTTSIGETIHMIWAAVPTSKDGADCSYGDSGGKAFVMTGVHSRSVGVLSVFIDFTGKLVGNATNGETVRKNFENNIGVDLSPYDAICGIATETPSENNGAEVIKPVNTYAEIPDYHNSVRLENPAFAEPLIQKAHDEFFDPNYVKTWVSGAINLDANGKGYWKMNPAIFYDKESGGAVIASFTDNAKDGLELNYVPDFKNQKFYGYPELSKISGELEVFTGMYGPDGFVSKDGGSIFGQYQVDPNAIRIIQESPTFSLYFDNSTQSLQIMQYK